MNTVRTQNITITDAYVKNAQNKLVDYLLSMDAKKFLFEFYHVAGLKPPTETGYQGWERSDEINFRGHFFGHFMSACALAYHAEKNLVKRNKIFISISEAVGGLLICQKEYGEAYPESKGYVSAFREVALDEIEGKKIPGQNKENVLVPWYNLHKILAGLLEIHLSMAGVDKDLSAQALLVASNFGDYIYQRMQKLPDKRVMLQTEYGGMNDSLYHLFERTGKKEHLLAATFFDEDELFQQLAQGQDVLSGKHANTQIPKFIGAIKRFRVCQSPEAQALLTDEEKRGLLLYYKAAKNFWQIVVDAHTYCTGGNSQSEHFHEPYSLYEDAELRNGDCTCETCNTHNMLKLTRHLYAIDPEPKYLDYYERTYINAILSSQHPETGMMMYFQPMGSGYNKVYNRPYEDFWCCTGTGIESFAKLADTYYVREENKLLVNLYFSNQLNDGDIALRQETDRSDMRSSFTIEQNTKKLLLGFRIPDWSRGISIKRNGQIVLPVVENGFAVLSEPVMKGDVMEVVLHPELQMVHTADNGHYTAFVYGPYVLAASLGDKDLDIDQPNGILVRVGTKDQLLPDTITYTAANWPVNYQSQFEKISLPTKTIAFKIHGIKEPLTLSPYYQMHNQRYGIYFKLVRAGSPEAKQLDAQKEKRAQQQAKIIDTLTNFDENNSEYAKFLTYEHSTVGAYDGRRYRQALVNGWFRYRFKTPGQETKHLFMVFHQEDSGKSLSIDVNGFTLSVKVKETTDGPFLTQEIDARQEAFQDETTITIRSLQEETPRLFGIVIEKGS